MQSYHMKNDKKTFDNALIKARVKKAEQYFTFIHVYSRGFLCRVKV